LRGEIGKRRAHSLAPLQNLITEFERQTSLRICKLKELTVQLSNTTPLPTVPRRGLADWLGYLTEPVQHNLEIDQVRRVRLLLRINLIFLMGTVGYAVLAPLAGPLTRQTLFSIGLVFLFALPAFLIGKRGKPEHYRLAVILTLTATMSGGYAAAIFTDGSYLTIAHFGIPFVGVLLSGVFFSLQGVTLVAALNLVIYLLVLALRIPLNLLLVGDASTIAAISPYSYIIAALQIATLSGVFLMFIRFRDQLDEDRTQARQQAAEQQRLAEELRELEKAKSAFLASMSHELRTPLNASINFTRFVLEGDVGEVNAQQKEMLTEVVDSNKHLLNLINDVLDMSKIEAGSLNLFVEEEVNLGQALQKVVTTGKGLLDDKPVTLTAELPDDLPRVRSDRQRLTQIFLNVISNACKFTEAGSITLRAEVQGETVLVSVRDSGPGIAAADIPLVFEAFKQTEAGLRHGGGTGLGMPISRSLVEAHGGRMWVESEVGHGATFYVSLPIKSPLLADRVIQLEKA
jgi:signal transduction histidine kinase